MKHARSHTTETKQLQATSLSRSSCIGATSGMINGVFSSTSCLAPIPRLVSVLSSHSFVFFLWRLLPVIIVCGTPCLSFVAYARFRQRSWEYRSIQTQSLKYPDANATKTRTNVHICSRYRYSSTASDKGTNGIHGGIRVQIILTERHVTQWV